MRIFLVVKVTDVNYNPLKGCTVEVDFGSSGPGKQTAQPAGPDGTFEILIPNAADSISVTVKRPPSFFAANQKVKIIRGTGSQNPSLSFANGFQDLNSVKVGGNSRAGVDFNLEIYFALGQLTDARAAVQLVKDQSAANPGTLQTIDPFTQPVIDFKGPTVINPAASAGWSLLRQAPIPLVVPKGKMFYARRIEIPELIAIWVPEKVLVSRQRNQVDPSTRPLNFHIFYHPSPHKLIGSYPFSTPFVDLICRYLFISKFQHKEMVNQHFASGANNIFIFPVGETKKWNGNFGGQNSILRLLQEVAFFVQRMDTIPIPLQKVGKCAVSGFSLSGSFVNQALALQSTHFDQNVLREIYGFDLRGVTPQVFAASLTAWRARNARKDSDPRKFRLYTTDGAWFSANLHVDRTATVIRGPAGSSESTGANSSVVFMPIEPFWTTLNPLTTGDGLSKNASSYQTFAANFKEVHQMIPGMFMQHALRNSQFK